MNFQTLLLQFLCVFFIASSAYGGRLPERVTSQYTDCYELEKFFNDDESSTSPHPHIDNVCIDSSKSTYHFLSSEKGAKAPLFTASISEMTVSFLVLDMLGILLKTPSQQVKGFRCYFLEPKHALNVYNSVYQHRTLTREDLTVNRIQGFVVESDTGDRIVANLEFSQRAAVYSELYENKVMILTFKTENANGNVGDPALIFVTNKFYISDVLAHQHIVLRSAISPELYVVLTFRGEFEANHFSNLLRGCFDPNTLLSIPTQLQETLEEVKSTAQE